MEPGFHVNSSQSSGMWDTAQDFSVISSATELRLYGSATSAPTTSLLVNLYDSADNFVELTGGSWADIASKGYTTLSIPSTSIDWTDIQYIDVFDGGVLGGESIDAKLTMLCAYGEENDSDGDGTPDEEDAFPNDPNEWIDTDGDGVGDNADAFDNDPTETIDSDGDGVGDNSDAFPQNFLESVDSDGDGVGDNSDAFPNDPTETTDSDGDGVGDNSDAFPQNFLESVDSDSDGVGDNSDAFPSDPAESSDTDDDGVGDNADAFPNDPTEASDTDDDGVGDNSDAFPNDPSETIDTDGDGLGNNSDGFPLMATQDVINEIISNPSIYNLHTENDIKDLRPGSTMIQISGNQATVQLQMEESSDLQTWEDTGTPATMTLPADTDTKFYRFKMVE